MNKIEAIFRPERLENIKTALSEVGIVGLTVTQVSGRGAQGGVEVTAARGLGTYRIDMLPKVKLEVVVNDAETDKAVDVIRTNAITGAPGDGKIFISPVADAIRIRTGEHGPDAV
jgi:nitrogen regulatory protein P-II 1